MSLAYLAAPIAGYLSAGCLKFLVNSARHRRLAFDLIGLGGLPSTHTTIVGTVAALIAFREGIDHPAFGVALALLAVVAIDAMDLRRKVGRQATALKRLHPGRPEVEGLRESVGHKPVEVAAGLALSLFNGWWLSWL